MKYNYETQRKNAFIICNGKLYEGDIHFDCMFKALDEVVGEDELDYNFDKYFNMEEKELSKLLGDDIPKGEIAMVDNIKILILYAEEELKKVKEY